MELLEILTRMKFYFIVKFDLWPSSLLEVESDTPFGNTFWSFLSYPCLDLFHLNGFYYNFSQGQKHFFKHLCIFRLLGSLKLEIIFHK